MRIAYFADNFYPEISGISDSIITTGEELRKRGHEVVYVAPRYGRKEYEPAQRFDANKKPLHDPRGDLPVRRVPSLPFPNSPTSQSRIAVPLGFMLPFMRRFKPDIIHSQAPHGVGLEALYTSRALGVPLIGTEHTPIEEFFHYSPAVSKTFGAAWLRWEVWYYNRCDFVTTPYQGLIEEMRGRGLRSRARVQANPVPFESMLSSAPQKEAAKKGNGFTGSVLLCSGRLAPEKKVDDIIKALPSVLKQFPNATLVVTGHGSAEAALKALTKKLGIENNVRFVGFVSNTQLETLYRAADIYLIMSTAETQSLSLMEAFASGIPAISARARGLIDYTPPECGFLIEPGDDKGLSEKILLLLSDNALRERMGSAGTQFVKKFTPQTIAEDWERIYQENLIN